MHNEQYYPGPQRAIRRATILAATIVLWVSGCARYTQPVAPPEPQTPAERNFDAQWRASIKVLREYHFEIDRQDRRLGLITTQKMLGKHWFEFWRYDAANADDLAEGTIQTLYRQVTVNIVPSDQADQFRAKVQVQVLRPQRQGKEIVAAGEAYGDFLDTANESDYLRDRRETTAADGQAPDSPRDKTAPVQYEQRSGGNNLALKLEREISSAAAKMLNEDN